jgi:hypothetical protein
MNKCDLLCPMVALHEVLRRQKTGRVKNFARTLTAAVH